MMADGLGHGLLAAQASEQAVQIFESSRMETVTAVIDEIDSGLRATRGAAVAVAEIRGDVVNFSGLGNISGCNPFTGRRPSTWCLITEQRACRRESLRSSHMSFGPARR